MPADPLPDPFADVRKLPDPFADVRERKASKPTAGPSSTDAALRGAAQGASFGFADEAMGMLRSNLGNVGHTAAWSGPLAGMVGEDERKRPGQTPPGTMADYKRARDDVRAADAAAAAAHPGAFVAGNLGGAVATAPLVGALTGPRMIAGGAAAGALGGAGSSESDDVAGLARDTATGAVVGGGAAGAVKGGAALVGAGARAAGRAGRAVTGAAGALSPAARLVLDVATGGKAGAAGRVARLVSRLAPDDAGKHVDDVADDVTGRTFADGTPYATMRKGGMMRDDVGRAVTDRTTEAYRTAQIDKLEEIVSLGGYSPEVRAMIEAFRDVDVRVLQGIRIAQESGHPRAAQHALFEAEAMGGPLVARAAALLLDDVTRAPDARVSGPFNGEGERAKAQADRVATIAVMSSSSLEEAISRYRDDPLASVLGTDVVREKWQDKIAGRL